MFPDPCQRDVGRPAEEFDCDRMFTTTTTLPVATVGRAAAQYSGPVARLAVGDDGPRLRADLGDESAYDEKRLYGRDHDTAACTSSPTERATSSVTRWPLSTPRGHSRHYRILSPARAGQTRAAY